MKTLNARLDSSFADITHDHGGFLRCGTCGRREAVDASYWRAGWPKCHGYTMTWWTQRQVDAGEVPSR